MAGAIFRASLTWQGPYFVKFGMIAGAPNVALFNAKCVSKARNVNSANRRAIFCEVAVSLFVAGAIFGKVAVCHLVKARCTSYIHCILHPTGCSAH